MDGKTVAPGDRWGDGAFAERGAGGAAASAGATVDCDDEGEPDGGAGAPGFEAVDEAGTGEGVRRQGPSAVGGVEELLEARSEDGGEFGGPRLVDETDADEIEDVDLVLSAERGEFDPDESVEIQHAERAEVG